MEAAETSSRAVVDVTVQRLDLELTMVGVDCEVLNCIGSCQGFVAATDEEGGLDGCVHGSISLSFMLQT